MGIKNLDFVNGQASACDDECLDSNTNETNNFITSSNQTPLLADPDQTGKAVANYVHASNFYDVTGTVDAIVLTPTTSFEGVTEYQDGALYRFRATGTNTVNNPTCDINSLGVKNILAEDGVSNISIGDIKSDKDSVLRYDGTNLLLFPTGFIGLTDTPSSYSGEAGKVPVVNSGDDALEFKNAGTYELISSTTASNVASVSFTDLSSTYAKYVVEVMDYIPQTDNTDLRIRTSSNNGSSYDSGATDYAWGQQFIAFGGVGGVGSSTGDTHIRAIGAVGNDTNEKVNMTLELTSHDTTKYTDILYRLNGTISAGTMFTITGGGWRASAAIVDAIQITAESGNINGIFKLYGIKAS